MAKRARFYIPDWKTFYATCRNEINYILGRNRGFRVTSVVVELSSRCNLDCLMCARHKVFERTGQDMGLDTFKTLVKMNPGVNLYILVGWGEMMLHPQFFEMAEYLKKQGKRVALTTNGTLLNTRNIERLLESGISHITVSIDGVDKVFEDLRGISFDQIEDKLQALSRRIRETGKDIYLEINSISTPEIMESAEELRARLGPWTDDIRFSSCMDYNSLQPTNRKKACRELWRGMISVLADGSVVPCCMDYNSSMVLGHVTDASLQELWNNDTTRNYRREHLRLQFNNRCATCVEKVPSAEVDKRFE